MPGYPTDRVIVYNRDATFAFELTPDEQRSRLRIEEINGEHSLTIKTTHKLSEGMRLITQDDTGKMREHVVYKPDEGHNKGKYAVGTYLCMWSLQYDLMTSYAHEHAEPGMGSSCTSHNAVVAALDGQSLWTVGACDVPAVAAGNGCVMIGTSAWERLSLVVKHWHGEIDAEIVMDDTRVIARRVNFRAHLGSTEVKRRFDWGEDLTNISRTPDPGPYYCRIVPLGRGQREYAEDDETEFDWPIDITEETGGIEYIEDSESALVFRTKLPDGTWHYPTKVVKYDEDDPELLLNAGNADLHNHTRPGCSYEANVLQFARAGMDAKGVQLGDNTQCVDFGFNPDAGLTVEGRVTRLEVEELAPKTKTNLTIGDLAPTFAQTMQELIGRQTASISDGIKRVEGGGTIVYLQHLLDEINAEINGTGGYSYLVPGEGIVTYDKRVAAPLVGTEATQVTQVKGGNIRIADTKKPNFSGINDWEWKTVIVSGHVAAELVTAAHITAGYIGSPNDAVFLDFDNHVFEIGNATTIGDTTVGDLLQDVASAGIDTIEYGTSASSATEPTTWSTTAPTSVAKGSWIWIRTIYKDGNSSTTKAYAGTDGQSGDDGTSIASITPQYYLSTSSSSTTGGAWANNPPVWSANHYIWTRNLITWDTTPTTTSTTDEVYDAALTQANKQAADAAKVATDYITDGTDGTDFGKTGVSSKVRITDSGMEVFDGNNDSALLAGLQNGNSVVRVGLSDETRAEIDYHSMKLVDKEGNAFFYVSDLRDSSGICTVVEQYVLEDHDPNVWDRATINLVLNAVDTNYTVTRNGVAITSGIYKYTTYFSVLNSANPRNGDKFVVTYQTDSVYAKAFTMGVRLANSRIGVMSMAEGRNCVASEAYSHAEGISSSATAYSAHAEGGIISNGSLTKASTASAVAAHAEGGSTASGVASHSEGYNTTASGLAAHSQGRSATASGRSSHAGGEGCTASGDYSHAEGHSTNASGEASATFGTGTKASRTDQFVCGRYNYDRRYGLFAVGYGTSSGTYSNIFDCSYNENDMGSAAIRMFGNVAGTVYVNGQSVHSSDKRLKDHVAYLEDDASDFIRALKPIRYKWKGGDGEHYGFYAQDVQDADPHDTEIVIESEKNEELGFTPLSLDYQALIAPLVAYAQQLEKRIDQQQQAIEVLTKRLDALEGR